MQATSERFSFNSEYSNYKPIFYTCKAAEQNKTFYPTTQNHSEHSEKYKKLYTAQRK